MIFLRRLPLLFCCPLFMVLVCVHSTMYMDDYPSLCSNCICPTPQPDIWWVFGNTTVFLLGDSTMRDLFFALANLLSPAVAPIHPADFALRKSKLVGRARDGTGRLWRSLSSSRRLHLRPNSRNQPIAYRDFSLTLINGSLSTELVFVFAATPLILRSKVQTLFASASSFSSSRCFVVLSTGLWSLAGARHSRYMTSRYRRPFPVPPFDLPTFTSEVRALLETVCSCLKMLPAIPQRPRPQFIWRELSTIVSGHHPQWDPTFNESFVQLVNAEVRRLVQRDNEFVLWWPVHRLTTENCCKC
eukprot:NODE_980_length_1192_cov_235.450569_g744_i0.p1 GENE.NODE_980_length_1192_cov_235.450569_g744_i0~~NODE_980_length_1192_cov_235.450569_g744_i0.p1  ORF type:complete len:301 (-),score=33.22 NODE_980_length_1192_cov_235.450569_g744_i0:225-1127(-)